MIGVIQNSFIYRWLTTPPDPDIIVIDLRETLIIAPFLTFLDRILAVLRPWFETSHLKHALNRLTILIAGLSDTRLGQTLVGLFEPPEWPKQASDENQDSDSDLNR